MDANEKILDAAKQMNRPFRANLLCFINTQMAIRHSIAGDVDGAILTDLLRKSLDYLQYTTAAATLELVIDQLLEVKGKHEFLGTLRVQLEVALETQSRADTLGDQISNIIQHCIPKDKNP